MDQAFFSSNRSLDKAEETLKQAKLAGADAADVFIARETSTSVSCRLGALEGLDREDREEISLRVFVGKRVSNVSIMGEADMSLLARQAVAMAINSPDDPYQSLADSDSLTHEWDDLDLFDPTILSPQQLKEHALEMESSALSVKGITNSSGANASLGKTEITLMTSHGFSGSYMKSYFSRSISVIAGQADMMQRDYAMSSRLHFLDLDPCEQIGKKAAEQSVKRLNPRKAETGLVDVIFDPRVARDLVALLAYAINGSLIARKTSFLGDKMEQKIMSDSICVTDEPLKKRAKGTRPFDGEGVQGEKLTIVDNGVLRHWLLSTSVARELGMKTNGRGVRSSSSVVPSFTNFVLHPGKNSLKDLMQGIRKGFYVTELIGQGADLLTGDYSKAASGFWIEEGELSFPVSGVSIASNLKEMFLRMTPEQNLDENFSIASPALLVEGMVLGGV